MSNRNKHPRDRFITVYGRKPVLEALQRPGLTYGRCLIAQNARGDEIAKIIQHVRAQGIQLERCQPKFVNRISRNARQDQGVALDVDSGRMCSLDDWISNDPISPALLLDGVDTPGNVGMIIRSAVAAEASGIILPRRGCPEVGPMVIKASAGTAFNAPLVRTESSVMAAERLVQAGHTLVGMKADAQESVFSMNFPKKMVWVLGNETHGISRGVEPFIRTWAHIPMPGSIESLNVAMASTIAVFESVRRQSVKSAPTGA